MSALETGSCFGFNSFLGIPLHPTLGSPARSLDEVYERIDNRPFVAEYKYDGQRAQIHAQRSKGGKAPLIRIFSRHLEDMTSKVGYSMGYYSFLLLIVSGYCVASCQPIRIRSGFRIVHY